MASENVDNLDRQLKSLIRSENGSGVSQRVIQLRPTTNNIVSSALRGDVIYQYTTSSGEFVDLSKLFHVLRYTCSSTTDFIRLDDLVDCVFNRAQLYLNGAYVSGSNNYTQDAIISKRVCKGLKKNKGYGNLDFIADGAATATSAVEDLAYESVGGLDALFLNTGKSVYIPPFTDIRMVFSADSNYIYKSAIGDGVDSTTTLAINDLFLRFNSIIADVQLPSNYMIKLNILDSFKTSIGAAAHNQQVTVRPNIVKVGAIFQSTGAESESLTKAYNTPHFTYATDGQGGATQLYTLYFKVGSQVLPSERLDVSTYGFRLAHNDFLSENQFLNTCSPEKLSDWLNQGPIYTYRVIKGIADSVQTIELNCTFKAQPAANSILFSINEQFVSLQYQNGVPSGTQTAI